MGVSLSKGGNVSLSKEAPGIENILVGLAWEERATDGEDFDLDGTVFMIDESGKVRKDEDFIFYRNLISQCGSVTHHGDNRTGSGEGDDEKIDVILSKVPADVQKLVFAVTIHEADQRNQNFGMVNNAAIRIVNTDNNTEVARYDLSEDASTNTAMIFGELYRHNGDWKFRAVGQGFDGGLGPLATSFGVSIG